MGWTCTGFAGALQVRHALMRAPTPAEALALLQRAADDLKAEDGIPVAVAAIPQKPAH